MLEILEVLIQSVIKSDICMPEELFDLIAIYKNVEEKCIISTS